MDRNAWLQGSWDVRMIRPVSSRGWGRLFGRRSAPAGSRLGPDRARRGPPGWDVGMKSRLHPKAWDEIIPALG